MEKTTLKFGIKTYTVPKDMWCFGINLSHFVNETYILINFFRWNICVGRMNVYEGEVRWVI